MRETNLTGLQNSMLNAEQLSEVIQPKLTNLYFLFNLEITNLLSSEPCLQFMKLHHQTYKFTFSSKSQVNFEVFGGITSWPQNVVMFQVKIVMACVLNRNNSCNKHLLSHGYMQLNIVLYCTVIYYEYCLKNSKNYLFNFRGGWSSIWIFL